MQSNDLLLDAQMIHRRLTQPKSINSLDSVLYSARVYVAHETYITAIRWEATPQQIAWLEADMIYEDEVSASLAVAMDALRRHSI